MRHIREESCTVKVVSVYVTKVYGRTEIQPPLFFYLSTGWR